MIKKIFISVIAVSIFIIALLAILNSKNDDMQNNYDEIDVASDTTLIIGKNNAGKTTIITALDNLINHNNALGANDFN